MRQKRAKAYRKLMYLYSMSFGFRQPYQVLVDSEMCKAAINQKLDFAKQLSVVLQGDVKPMITQCCIHELYLQGKEHQPATDLAKTFERRKCNHREPIPGDDCLLDVVVVNETNKHRYVVATQSTALRSKLRETPAVPVVHINRSVTILEPPSEATLKSKELMEDEALRPSASETSRLAPKTVPEEPPKTKKRTGPKGPNPLSVKKKKPKESTPAKKHVDNTARVGEKRKHEESEGASAPVDLKMEAEASGHKRKRRRKGKSSEVTEAKT